MRNEFHRTRKKYREFDLIFDKNASNPFVKVVSNNAFIKYNETIHVIEYAAFEKLKSDLEIVRDVLNKNKEEWEVVHPNGFKYLVAWQMCRDTVAALQARIDGYEKIEGEK